MKKKLRNWQTAHFSFDVLTIESVSHAMRCAKLLTGTRNCLPQNANFLSIETLSYRCFCASSKTTVAQKSPNNTSIPLPSYSSSSSSLANPFQFKSIEAADVSQDPKKIIKKRRKQRKYDALRRMRLRRQHYFEQLAERRSQVSSQIEQIEENDENNKKKKASKQEQDKDGDEIEEDLSAYHRLNQEEFFNQDKYYNQVFRDDEHDDKDDVATGETKTTDTAAASTSDADVNANATTAIDDSSIIIDKFQQLGISNALCQALECMNITQPSSIQLQVIPHLLSKLGITSDYKITSANNIFKRKKHLNEITLFGDATGTGKTLAYLLPIIDAIKRDEYIGEYFGDNAICKAIPLRQGRPRCLILAPTRELCGQIRQVIKDLNFYGQIGISSMELCAGSKLIKQLKRLRAGVDIVIGTPERVLQHLKMSEKYKHASGNRSQTGFYLTDCKYVVLDEGDILLNERFWDEHVKEILLSSGAFNAPPGMYDTDVDRKTGEIIKRGKFDRKTLRKMYGKGIDLSQLFPLTLKEKLPNIKSRFQKRMNFVICSATLTDKDVELSVVLCCVVCICPSEISGNFVLFCCFVVFFI